MTTPAYPCASVPEVSEGNYGRLCPCPSGNWKSHNDDDLAALAALMRDSPAKRKARAEKNRTQQDSRTTTIPSGYVYLGQFIDHDITRDIQTLDEAGPNVAKTLNYRTPRLDLDVLYGKDPAAISCLYETDGRLKLGPTEELLGNGRPPMAQSFEDLPRSSDGTALVVDPRSDENLLIAQLHVLFIKFHNCVLRLLREKPELSPGPAEKGLFEQARRFVTWHYQWIVAKEFLPMICRKAVLNDIAQNGFTFFQRPYTPDDDPIALPVEFNVAAFRFGHSMIQSKYFLNDSIGILPSAEIITMTRRSGGITPASPRLPNNHVVDWKNHFFVGLPGQLNLAQPIDTSISDVLYDLPPLALQAFRLQLPGLLGNALKSKMRPPLPELTLRRASKIGLPSGQEFANYFHLPIAVPEDQMHVQPEDQEFFERTGLAQRTPLWYYLLREAAVEPNPERGEGPDFPVQKLGSIGSRIVAEVLLQLLNADSESIRHAGNGWEPPSFTYGASGRKWSLRSMPRLVDFVGQTGVM